MALRIRLARAGRTKSPFYRIVVADVRARRDGRYIEKVGIYNPLLPQGDEGRVRLVGERITHWLSQGAKPTPRVAKFLGAAGLAPVPEIRTTPQKSAPGKKAQALIAEKAEKEAAAKAALEEAKTATAVPVEEEAQA